MKVILNIVWLVFGGLIMALGYVLVGLVCFATIIGIPFGIACIRLANYCLWPFGRTAVTRRDSGAGALVGNLLWLLLAGWWLALGHVVAALAYFATIIGIPLGLASLKIVPITLFPLGVEIVPSEDVRRAAGARRA
jgi:uncharacterized membrane protein YccF (DUF307 family)